MNVIDFPIERINEFLDKHIFSVPYEFNNNLGLENNIKIKLTGVKNYISVGTESPHIQYTIYILPSSPEMNKINLYFADFFGKNDIQIHTKSVSYYFLRNQVDQLLNNFLKYFGIDSKVICTRIIIDVKPNNIQESLIYEGILDKTTRVLVKDVLKLFKHQREGDWSLPEDLTGDDMVYELPGFDGYTIELNLVSDENITGVDVDANLYYDDDLVEITIISNPDSGYSNLSELTQELNEVIRHELEHIRQHDQGMKIPEVEPEAPEDYYSQEHEIEAQRAGFKKRSKSEKREFESVVRNWFQNNKHKHKLDQEAAERVIQKILSRV